MAVDGAVILLEGQSNMEGFDATGGGNMLASSMANDASIRFFCCDGLGQHTSPAALGTVGWGQTHHGPEQSLGATLKAAGWTNITILKGTRNGQPIANFMPGGADFYRLHRVITGGRPRRAVSRFFFIFMQGEADALTLESSEAQANDWGNRFNSVYAAVSAAAGQTPYGGKIIGRISSGIYGAGQATTAAYISNVRTQQATVADHLIDLDDIPLYAADILHFTGPGMHTIGTRYANKLIEIAG